MVKLENDNHKNDVKRFDKAIFWIILAVLLIMIGATRCSAQEAVVDTMPCHIECVKEFVKTQGTKNNVKIYAVYDDSENNICDVIPVPKTVYEYIITCHTHNIRPNLGIRLRNGQITGIIRYKPVYRRKK